ncbi:acyl-CoA synthetase short-chain family member 3, mitochondrial-like [Tigriopus californicus]|uniref:acyl-CoA synthetase short-chain family member 3, mitochondrial-like n=1 Tax=Tigriopus californicus TaxID=6832 RepID=UPI0027DA0B86|nr:acyl-CoA synthetase short-chain family member 3, mitochondrial-like [Tigriopus californicus]XP_059079646.1 acyl-CoA synthetase short-chain family member 3, mitochondrial-like [Tigriopus californicus]
MYRWSSLSKSILGHPQRLLKECRRALHEVEKLDLVGDKYRQEFQKSIQNPEEYWGEISQNIIWTKPWTKVLDDANSPFTKWFPGGRLSLCYNALDRHVDEGRGNRDALIWDSPITGNKDTYSFLRLQKEVSSLAAILSGLGVQKGDRTLIYMPMIPQTVVAMLASARLGAPHSVVFGGFAAKELSTRIRHCQPKAILCASCGVEPSRTIEYKPIIDEALRLANAPDIPVVVYQRPDLAQSVLKPNDLNWDQELSKGQSHDCVEVDSDDPLYILYTSGTTGTPKGVQHPTGGHAVVNKWTMNALYGMSPDEVWWAASDFGWIVGHEYICYSPLLNGNTSIIYEGKPVGTPDAGQFFRVISEHNVSGLFTAPTALRAIKRVDHDILDGKQYDISSLKYLFVAGEHCDHDTRLWCAQNFKVPILDHWWQTETAHAITATCVGLGNGLYPPKDVTGLPVPGFNVKVLNESGEEAKAEELGRIVCKLPMPPGTFSTLYQAESKFEETYFTKYPGYYDTMDAGMQDEHGYVKVLARDDDVINVAGHRLSTSAIEEAIEEHEDVEEAVVIGVPDELKGQVPLALFIMRKDGHKTAKEISSEIVQMVRLSIGPVAAFKLSVAVTALPRTRSGKTARKSIADLAQGKHVKIPPTIEDALVYEPILEILRNIGFAKNASVEI